MPAPTEVNEISCPGGQKLPGAAAGVVVPDILELNPIVWLSL
jgi:hypothetical protein